MNKLIENKSVVVIIPYYNGSKYIERSVKSVLNQTILPDEFIVIDDGSSPDEAAFLDEIANKMDFKVLHKENGGQGSARNYGVQHTRSRFISFLDQDDFYLPSHIETLLDAVDYDDPNFGWVYADLCEADEDGNIFRTGILRSMKDNNGTKHPKDDVINLISYDLFVLPSASLISRDAFEAVDGFDSQFTGYEDDDLFLRIFRKGFSNHFIDKAVTVWCINSNSTSYSIKMCRSRFKYITKLCEMFPDDRDKNKFYIKDCIFPRFAGVIISEAKRSIKKPKTENQLKFYQNRTEIIKIMDDFFTLIKKNAALSRRQQFKLWKISTKIKLKNFIRSLFNDYNSIN